RRPSAVGGLVVRARGDVDFRSRRVRAAARASDRGGPAVTTEPTGQATTPAAPRGRRHTVALVALGVAALVLGLGIYSGGRARSKADVTLKQATDEAAVIPVNVGTP